MTIWDKVKEGIDKAGKAAHDVIDDGKTRLDAYRARESADKAAEAFGYAVFRAMELGQELDTESRNRLMLLLRERDAEAHRLEKILAAEKAADTAPNTTTHAADSASHDTSHAGGSTSHDTPHATDTAPGTGPTTPPSHV